jgi:hypothetical protein
MRLTLHVAIAHSEKLCFVVPGDGGIGVAVSRQERQLFGKVGCHFLLIFQRYSFNYIKFLFLKFYLLCFKYRHYLIINLTLFKL